MQKNKPNPWVYVAGIFIALLVLLMVFNGFLSFLTPEITFSRGIDLHAALEFRETIEILKLALSTVNLILLAYLLYNYVKIYQEVQSQFALGLIVLAAALLVHTITSSPIVSQLFGFRGTGLGPFAIIPSFFTLITALVLIYLSQQ